HFFPGGGMRKPAVVALLYSVAFLEPFAVEQSWMPVPANTIKVGSKVSTTPAPANQTLKIVVGLRLQNVSSIESLLDGLRGGKSTPLKHAAFVSEYSPTASQVQPVVDYLSSMGFINVKVSQDNLLVSAQGTVAQAEKAFHTSIAEFTLSGRPAYAPAGPVLVPSSLGNIVLEVLGLSNATEISRKLSAGQNLKVMDQTKTFVMNPSAG